MKYVEVGGGEERWLPTFERGGYLDLLRMFLPDIDPQKTITKDIAGRFQAAIEGMMRPSENGNLFEIEAGKSCPACSSKNLVVINEHVVQNPSLAWLELEIPEGGIN